MKCLIVDDELMARTYLEKLCAKVPTLELVASCASAEEAIDLMNEKQVDILFLDVEMPGLNGLELLNRLSYLPKVIMTTSKKEYAFEAFEYQVVDYLKKPISFPRFRQAVEKVLMEQEMTQEANTSVNPENNLETVIDEEIYIKDNGRLVKVRYKDIFYIENVGDYAKVVTKSDSHTIHGTIKGIASKLPKKYFLKVHRSYIINVKEIVDFESNSILVGEKLVPVSRAHKQDLLDRLNLL